MHISSTATRKLGFLFHAQKYSCSINLYINVGFTYIAWYEHYLSQFLSLWFDNLGTFEGVRWPATNETRAGLSQPATEHRICLQLSLELKTKTKDDLYFLNFFVQNYGQTVVNVL